MSDRLNSSLDQEPNTLEFHLIELRKRLIWVIAFMALGTGVSFLYVEQVYNFLTVPLSNAMGVGDTHRLIYTGLTEAFFTYMKVAFFAGVFLTFPALLMQIWMFIAPGLYKAERRVFLPFFFATPVLFLLGGMCVYFVVLPTALPFFLSFQSPGGDAAMAIQLEARVSEYLDLVMILIFAFGLCFQLPVVLTLLGRAGIVKAEGLAKGRKYAIILTFILAAFLTPPDILSQILLSVPILALYELSILCIRLTAPKTDYVITHELSQ